LEAGPGHGAVAGIAVITRPGGGAAVSASVLDSVVAVVAGRTWTIVATDIASSKIMNARVASST
jgi:hypothetical protein